VIDLDNTVYSGLETTVTISKETDQTVSTTAFGEGVIRVEAEAPGEYEVKLGNEIDGKPAWVITSTVQTTKVGDYYELVFYGCGVSVLSYLVTNRRMFYSIDGESEVEAVLTAPSTGESYGVAFSVAGLAAGKHTIRITHRVDSGFYTIIESFDIL
jgi:hypothetical protein